MTRVVALATLVTAASANAQCAVYDDCRCSSQPEWAAIVRLNGDSGAVLESIQRAQPGDGGPREEDLAAFIGPPVPRFLVTSNPEKAADYNGYGYPIGADGQVHCARDAGFEEHCAQNETKRSRIPARVARRRGMRRSSSPAERRASP